MLPSATEMPVSRMRVAVRGVMDLPRPDSPAGPTVVAAGHGEAHAVYRVGGLAALERQDVSQAVDDQQVLVCHCFSSS